MPAAQQTSGQSMQTFTTLQSRSAGMIVQPSLACLKTLCATSEWVSCRCSPTCICTAIGPMCSQIGLQVVVQAVQYLHQPHLHSPGRHVSAWGQAGNLSSSTSSSVATHQLPYNMQSTALNIAASAAVHTCHQLPTCSAIACCC